MEKIFILILAVFSLPANSAYLSSVEIDPYILTPNENISAKVYGDLADTGTVILSSNLSFSNNTFTFDVFTVSTGGFQVLVPFEITRNLGQLASGNYSFTVNGYIENTLKSSLGTSFSVSEVPLPAAAWLFGSALVRLVGLKRK